MDKLIEQLLATSPWEAAAVLLSLAYTLLAVRRNLLCWLCAVASTILTLVVVVRANLSMQVVLNLFYLGMAVYGFIDWRRGRTSDGEVMIRAWRPATHALVALLVFAASAINFSRKN